MSKDPPILIIPVTATLAQMTARPLNGADAHEFRIALLETGRDMGADAVIEIRRAVLELSGSSNPLLQQAGLAWSTALVHALELARSAEDAVEHARKLELAYRRGLEAWNEFNATPRAVDENTVIVDSFRLTCLALRRTTRVLHRRIVARAWSA